jgi:bile acid-coenzyme A ligase
MMPEQPVSFGRRIADLAQAHPDAVAIIFSRQDGTEDALDWRALDRWANRAARLLAANGAGPGTMVCVGLPNSLEHYAATIGAWRCGACVLPLSPRMPDHEFGGITGLLDRKVVVADRTGATVGRAEIAALRDGGTWSDAALPNVTPHPGKSIGSGGSTGRPKIIVDPKPWARVPGALGDLIRVGFRSGDVQLVAGPLYHNSPFSWSHFGLFEDQRLIVMERFDPERAVSLIERHRCQFMFFPPIMLLRISRLPDFATRDLSSIYAIFQTAASCPPWLKRLWIDRLGPERLIEAYGSSEALGNTRITGTDWLEHPGSVGRADEAVCEMRVLDPEMREVPAGTVGEIFFRPKKTGEPPYYYIGSPPARSARDGFASVGDLGYVDEQGYLFIVDRRVDMIVTGGANVYPAEIEAALTEHPAVTDAAVIGLADEEWGRRVHAIVQAAEDAAWPSEAELDAWLRDRLTPYKLPKSYEIVAALPRDPSGKIRRSALVAERERERV